MCTLCCVLCQCFMPRTVCLVLCVLAPDVRRRSATCFMFPPIHLQGRPHFPIADWDLALITTWTYPLWLVGFRFRPMKYILHFYQYVLCTARSKLECFFPLPVVSNYLIWKHSLAPNFNICLPLEIVEGALPRKSREWTGSMCGCQAPPLYRWSRYALLALWAAKAKILRSTLTYLPFLNISQYAWRGSQMTGFPSEVFLTTDQKWMWQQHCMISGNWVRDVPLY